MSKPPLDAKVIRSPDFAKSIEKLASIGDFGGKRIPGEDWAEKNAPKQAPLIKPNAKVRLFIFSGLGGFAVSLRDWWVSYVAPSWIEVRPLEFPGHGWRETEPLPFMAGSKSEPKNFLAEGAPVDFASCEKGRLAEIGAIADAIAPMLDKPYAIYGFCSGAIHAYLLTKELEKRKAPPPLRLFNACCMAPHAINEPDKGPEDLPKMLAMDNDATIEWAIKGGALPPASERVWEPSPKFAETARSDAVMFGVVVGDQTTTTKDEKTGIV